MPEESKTKRERQRQRRAEKEQAIMEAHVAKRKKRNIILASSGVVVVVVVVLIVWLVQRGGGDDVTVSSATTTTQITTQTITLPQTTTQPTETGDNMPNYTPFTPADYGQGECPPDEVPSTPVLEFASPPKLCLDLAKQYDAIITTSEGVIKVRLDVENTPGTANNFATLSRFGYYNGSQLFRTDPSIAIIQGGGPHNNSPSDPGPGYTIKDEGTEFKYVPGDLVMARTGAPNSAGAQFFFAVNETTSLLDGQGVYVTFGKTIEGLDVLETILGLHVDDPNSGLGGGPSRTVTVEKVEIVEATS